MAVDVRPILSRIATYHGFQSEEEEVKEDSDLLVKAGSLIFEMIKMAGAAVYDVIFGSEIEDEERFVDEAMPLMRSEGNLADLIQNSVEDEPFRSDLRKILHAHMVHVKENVRRKRNITLLSGSGLACAAAGVVAGLFVIKWLLTTAIIVAYGIAALSIYNYVKNPEKSGDIKNLFDEFKEKYKTK